jgi:hypothetical protein
MKHKCTFDEMKFEMEKKRNDEGYRNILHFFSLLTHFFFFKEIMKMGVKRVK